jgi:hypothetical protein
MAPPMRRRAFDEAAPITFASLAKLLPACAAVRNAPRRHHVGLHERTKDLVNCIIPFRWSRDCQLAPPQVWDDAITLPCLALLVL